MLHLYQEPKRSRSAGLSLLLGLVPALLIFLLVPLTQLFRPPAKTVQPLEEVVLAVPPPPPPPVETPPPPLKREEERPPELNEPPPMPTLEQLELSLNPGTGGALSVEVGLDLNFKTESAQQMIDLFGFDELDEIPRLIREGMPRLKQSREYLQLLHRNVEKSVTLTVIVDERGYVEVTDVAKYTHRELIPAAKQVAESSRFSAPIRNGKPVRAKYTWTLSF